ncbi:MAG: DUF3368 domain-containing protein [Xanthomonadales bacterium]|jgi:hypothetical protein|nr:DUF3368 domain-containing protein [Xanthomonadales bacterium]
MSRIRLGVVCDSGPLIALAICGQLEQLTLFEAVHVPAAVLLETTADLTRPGADAITRFVAGHAQVHPDRPDPAYAAAVAYLDEGEAQALSLALALGCGVLIDERRGRLAAQRQGLPVFGVLGLLLHARRAGRIAQLRPALDRLQTGGYRIAPALCEEALRLAGEAP